MTEGGAELSEPNGPRPAPYTGMAAVTGCRVTLAYSPCPNDTFVFAAWTKGMLAGAPFAEVVLDDVEALNEAAKAGRFELTKASYGAIPYLVDRYRLLPCGGALGRGCGPLVVARPRSDGTVPALHDFKAHSRFAVPGVMTTAFLLLRLALGRPIDAVAMRFDRIVPAVARGDVDAGLIIHESRFTFPDAGLAAVADLGRWWEAETGKPIPLGAILVRRDIADATARRLSEAIRASLTFAERHEAAVLPYVREHALEMSAEVMRAHIALYVNNYTHDVGDDGRAAVEQLLELAAEARLIPRDVRAEFVAA